MYLKDLFFIIDKAGVFIVAMIVAVLGFILLYRGKLGKLEIGKAVKLTSIGDEVEEKDHKAQPEEEAGEADESVQPTQVGDVVGDATVHPIGSQPEHRQEGQVEPDEHPPEMDPAENGAHHLAGHLHRLNRLPGIDTPDRLVVVVQHLIEVLSGGRRRQQDAQDGQCG